MSAYNSLFFSIYQFIQSIERGYYYQDDSNRAFYTVCALTILEMGNLVSLGPSFFKDEKLYFTLAIILGINYFLFFFKRKYVKIVSDQKTNTARWHKYISLLYVLITTVAYYYTNM